MAIPDFQSAMLPLLRYLADGRPRSNQEILEAMEQHFVLNEEERRQLLPSGKQRVFANRVAWAKAHLKKAGLLESPRRGVYRISELGQQVIAQDPKHVGCNFLRQFPSYVEFVSAKKNNDAAPGPEPGCEEDQTPEEVIEARMSAINFRLAEDLLAGVKGCSPYFFEKLVVELLLAMGYGGSRQEAGRTTSKGNDGGIDGIINEDRLGLDVIYLQAKRWDSCVSRPEIQKFAGALQGKRAKKGVYITTSTFSQGAWDYVRAIDSRIILIDGKRLAELMLEHNLGVVVQQTYQLKRLDQDYFLEE